MKNLRDRFLTLPKISEVRELQLPEELLIGAYTDLRKLGWDMLREIRRLQFALQDKHGGIDVSDRAGDRNTRASVKAADACLSDTKRRNT